MGRLACVSVAAFPLQLLLQRHPDWSAHPAAVVEEDRPQAQILWVNERARRSGVLPGQRYAAGLALAPTLRAGVISAHEIVTGVAALTARLHRLSPAVEPSADEPGVFRLSADGLEWLYPVLWDWASRVLAEVRAADFRATVVVGFTRFGTYAVAKVRQGATVFRSPDEERAAASRVPLSRLAIEPAFREALRRLGITTVADLVRLPAGGLRERFGPDAARLHAFATGDLWTPLVPQPEVEALRQRCILDVPEADASRLLFLIKQLLDPLLAALASREEALAELVLRLLLDRAGGREARVRPAAPTLESVQLMDLVRLRLESLALPAGAVEVEVEVSGAPATPEQLRLFTERPRRDLDAANRALARVRAEFGEGAVVRAVLREGHLPEATFAWEPLERIHLPQERPEGMLTLVRRIFVRPQPMPPKERHLRDGGWVAAAEHGPYVLSGGWWRREVHREYYFAETPRGEVLWVYYDHRRRRWYQHGRVE